MSIIVALSGGKASAWCANYALENYYKKDVILYFNDTKWEHPDLYRFLCDLQKYLNHRIIRDTDGRSPEDLFYEYHAIANNRMPFCSRVLKAERLQRFYKDGDTLIFGIGLDEQHRADRIIQVYQKCAAKTGKFPKLCFPLIEYGIKKKEIEDWLSIEKIKEPYLYSVGFTHNNCSGGCVRAGKKQWKLLYDTMPHVYMDRERLEQEVRKFFNKDISIFKDETLKDFRGRIERKELSDHYYNDDKESMLECVGICSTMS